LLVGTVSAVDRAPLCARTGCGVPAGAQLTYRYASRTAWIDDLSGEVPPSSYPLCDSHADTLKVPVGWAREDRRSAGRLPFPHTRAS
jgi:hypothetical protein